MRRHLRYVDAKLTRVSEAILRIGGESRGGGKWHAACFVAPTMFDLLCFSHLRWDFVFQRPQHLLTRGARQRRVFYVEEPLFDAETAHFDVRLESSGVHVVVPHLTEADRRDEGIASQRRLLRELCAGYALKDYVVWYYTPMALPVASELRPLAIVYDCMDELSAFKNAPKELLARERTLLAQAGLVFTGGQALFEAKRRLHHNIHAFPSSVDRAHFERARKPQPDPDDQRGIARPRLGFCGVIDERMDLELLDGIAALRPDWQLVMVGPVVKIDPADLPRRPNIHYLGGKSYDELPRYLAGWDVAIMPFAKNESTRFISPTKTPEYLAAGKRVVSTSIRDVVRPYSVQGLARIADTPSDFVTACEAALTDHEPRHLRKVDAFLSGLSWDRTWEGMARLIELTVEGENQRESGQRLLPGYEDEALEVG